MNKRTILAAALLSLPTLVVAAANCNQSNSWQCRLRQLGATSTIDLSNILPVGTTSPGATNAPLGGLTIDANYVELTRGPIVLPPVLPQAVPKKDKVVEAPNPPPPISPPRMPARRPDRLESPGISPAETEVANPSQQVPLPNSDYVEEANQARFREPPAPVLVTPKKERRPAPLAIPRPVPAAIPPVPEPPLLAGQQKPYAVPAGDLNQQVPQPVPTADGAQRTPTIVPPEPAQLTPKKARHPAPLATPQPTPVATPSVPEPPLLAGQQTPYAVPSADPSQRVPHPAPSADGAQRTPIIVPPDPAAVTPKKARHPAPVATPQSIPAAIPPVPEPPLLAGQQTPYAVPNADQNQMVPHPAPATDGAQRTPSIEPVPTFPYRPQRSEIPAMLISVAGSEKPVRSDETGYQLSVPGRSQRVPITSGDYSNTPGYNLEFIEPGIQNRKVAVYRTKDAQERIYRDINPLDAGDFHLVVIGIRDPGYSR